MKQNKLTFDTEIFVVHWLEISIEGLYSLEEIQVLANYFNRKLEFNSTFRESDKRVVKVLSAILQTNLMFYLSELV
jgi:hypothetical protein